MYVIYRKEDRLIAGHVYDRKTQEQTARALAQEVVNVLNSELGGISDDYGVLQLLEEDLPKLTEIDPDNGINLRIILFDNEENLV